MLLKGYLGLRDYKDTHGHLLEKIMGGGSDMIKMQHDTKLAIYRFAPATICKYIRI